MRDDKSDELDQEVFFNHGFNDVQKRLADWAKFNELLHSCRKLRLHATYTFEAYANVLLMPGLAICTYASYIDTQTGALNASFDWANLEYTEMTWDSGAGITYEAWCQQLQDYVTYLYRNQNGRLDYYAPGYPGAYTGGALIFCVGTETARDIWEGNNQFREAIDKDVGNDLNQPKLDEVVTWAEIRDVYTTYIDNLGIFMPTGYIVDQMSTRLLRMKVAGAKDDYVVCEYNFGWASQAQAWSAVSPIPVVGWAFSTAMAPQRASRVLVPRVRAFGRQETPLPSFERYHVIYLAARASIPSLFDWPRLGYYAFMSRIFRSGSVPERFWQKEWRISQDVEDVNFPSTDRPPSEHIRKKKK